MKNQHSAHPDVTSPEIEILTVRELSPFLKRSPGAIRNLVLRRQIPHRKCSGRLVFFKNEIESWLKTSPGVTLEQLLGEVNS